LVGLGHHYYQDRDSVARWERMTSTKRQDVLGVVMRRMGLALIVVCVVCLGGTAISLGTSAVRQRILGLLSSPRGYSVGDRIDLAPAVYQASPLTVVLFARASCQACRAAGPFLSGLVTAAHRHMARLVFASTSEAVGDRAFGISLGVAEGDFISGTTALTRLKGVPTILVIDRTGVVQFVLEGAPATPEAGTAFLQAIESVLRHSDSGSAAGDGSLHAPHDADAVQG